MSAWSVARGWWLLHVLDKCVRPPSTPLPPCALWGSGPGQGSLPPARSHEATAISSQCLGGTARSCHPPERVDVTRLSTHLPPAAPQRTQWWPRYPAPARCALACFHVAGVSRDVAVFADLSPCPFCFSVGF